jgi:hypothetical protein
MNSTFLIIYNICSDMLQTTLENTEGYQQLYTNSKSLRLLEMIKEVMFTQKERKNPATALIEAQAQLIGHKQHDMLVQKYHNIFSHNREVLRLCGGMITVT